MHLNKKPLNVVLNQNCCFTKIKAIPLNDTKFKFYIAVAKTWIRTYNACITMSEGNLFMPHTNNKHPFTQSACYVPIGGMWSVD